MGMDRTGRLVSYIYSSPVREPDRSCQRLGLGTRDAGGGSSRVVYDCALADLRRESGV